MSAAKTEKFTTEETELADIAKALAHPARVKILKILSNKNICMCGDIVNLLPLAQATVSQHLKELKRVGFIQGEIEGPKTCYCLNNTFLAKAEDSLIKYFNKIKKGKNSSCKTKKR